MPPISGAGQVGAGAVLVHPTVRYPVTLLLGLQYIALAVFPAIINGNQYLPFIASIVFAGLLTTFVVETLFRIDKRGGSVPRPVRYPKPASAWMVMLIGSMAHIVVTFLGGGTYATQIGVTVASPLVALLTPLLPWALFGCGFGLASWRGGMMARRSLVLLILVALLVNLIAVLKGGIYEPLMNFAFALAAGLVLMRFLRPRWLVVGLVVAVLVWPILYSVRSATRQLADTAALGAASSGAQSRFREDLLLQQAAQFGQLNVAQPTVVDIARFGLIPRFLDPGRGQQTTAFDLNIAIGGTSDSAATFTVLGTLWSLDGGYVAVVVYAGLVAVAFSLVVRRLTPARVAFAMFMVSNLLWIESTYPVNIAAILQGVISLAVAMSLSTLLGARPHLTS